MGQFMGQKCLTTSCGRSIVVLAEENILTERKRACIECAADEIRFGIGMDFNPAKVLAKSLPYFCADFAIQRVAPTARGLDVTLGRGRELPSHRPATWLWVV